MASSNYVLGRGRLFFSTFATGTLTPVGEMFIGNCPSININITSETLDHMSSTGGVREIDDSATVSTTRNGTFTTDDVDAENLALFFFGTVGTVSSTSGSVTGEALGPVLKNRFYQLGATAQNPTGVRNVSAVTLTGVGGTPTFVNGTDYRVDLALGRIEIIPAGAIANNTAVLANYTRSVNSREQVISGNRPITGALRFIADNPKGANRDFYMPYVELSPNGDFAVITDTDWQQLPFNIKILKPPTAAALYIDGRAA